MKPGRTPRSLMSPATTDAAEAARGAAAEPDAGEAPFLLRARIDIVAVLRDVARTRTLVHAHFGSARDSLLTPLLAVDGTAGEIVFDSSGSERLNRSLMQAQHLLFYTSHGEVTVRFITAGARRVRHEGKEAFAVRLPDTLLRLQRRECHRVLAPVAVHSIRCLIAIEASSTPRYVDTRVHDISQGGASIIVQPGEFPVEVGKRYPNCRIVLPETGHAVVTLETVFTCDPALLNGQAAARIGCRYVRPTIPALALIQRHMLKLERGRRSRQ